MSVVQRKAELLRKLQALSPAARQPVKAAIASGLTQIVSLQTTLVPRRTGRLAGTIGWKWGSDGADVEVARLGLKVDEDLTAQNFVGTVKYFYARFVERGTRAGRKGASYLALRKNRRGQLVTRARKIYRTHPGTKAEPFFYPPWLALKTGIKSSITRAASAAFKAVAKQ